MKNYDFKCSSRDTDYISEIQNLRSIEQNYE